MCVRWGHIVYSSFGVSNGLKQGGILSPTFLFFILKRIFIEINKTIYRIVEKKDIRNTFRVKRNEREESMAAMMIINCEFHIDLIEQFSLYLDL